MTTRPGLPPLKLFLAAKNLYNQFFSGERKGGVRDERGRERVPLLHLCRHRRLHRVHRIPRRRVVKTKSDFN